MFIEELYSFNSPEYDIIKKVLYQCNDKYLDVNNISLLIENYIYKIEKEYNINKDGLELCNESFRMRFDMKDGEHKEYCGETGVLLSDYNYERSFLQGECKEYFYNGVLRCIKHYKKGLSSGLYHEWWINGLTNKIVEYDCGIKNGSSTEFSPLGQLICHFNYKNNKLDGHCIEMHYINISDIVINSYDYLPDEIENLEFNWYGSKENEIRLISQIESVKSNVQYLLKQPQHEQSVSYYKNGKLHGEYIEYCKNGNIYYKMNYVNGVKDGLCTEYYRRHKKMNEDELQIKSIFMYKNNKCDGIYKRWYRSRSKSDKIGQLAVDGIYKDGKIMFNHYKKWNINGELINKAFQSKGLVFL